MIDLSSSPDAARAALRAVHNELLRLYFADDNRSVETLGRGSPALPHERLPVDDASPACLYLLYLVESILSHHLRQQHFLRASTPFDLFELLQGRCMSDLQEYIQLCADRWRSSGPEPLPCPLLSCNHESSDARTMAEHVSTHMPDFGKLIEMARELHANGTARTRAFLRLALCDEDVFLGDCIDVLVSNEAVLAEFYAEDALLRDEELRQLLVALLASLRSVRFRLTPLPHACWTKQYWAMYETTLDTEHRRLMSGGTNSSRSSTSTPSAARPQPSTPPKASNAEAMVEDTVSPVQVLRVPRKSSRPRENSKSRRRKIVSPAEVGVSASPPTLFGTETHADGAMAPSGIAGSPSGGARGRGGSFGDEALSRDSSELSGDLLAALDRARPLAAAEDEAGAASASEEDSLDELLPLPHQLEPPRDLVIGVDTEDTVEDGDDVVTAEDVEPKSSTPQPDTTVAAATAAAAPAAASSSVGSQSSSLPEQLASIRRTLSGRRVRTGTGEAKVGGADGEQYRARLREEKALAKAEEERRRKASSEFGRQWHEKAPPSPILAALARAGTTGSGGGDLATFVPMPQRARSRTGDGLLESGPIERPPSAGVLVIDVSPELGELIDWLKHPEAGVSTSGEPFSGEALLSWLRAHRATPAETEEGFVLVGEAEGDEGGEDGGGELRTQTKGERQLQIDAVCADDARELLRVGAIYCVDGGKEVRPDCLLAFSPDFEKTVVLHSSSAATDQQGVALEMPRTRPVWKEDHEAKWCHGCFERFHAYRRRRHHCRSCGLIFCSQCCSTRIPLPNLGYTKRVLVCDKCLQTFYSGATRMSRGGGRDEDA